jgi:hypothetical protein
MRMTQEATSRSDAIAAGAENLLLAGAGLKAGQHLLIVVEPPGAGHYEDGLAQYLVEAAHRIGARVEILTAPLPAGPESIPAEVLASVEAAEHTVFLHRIGDQLRFRPVPGKGTKLVSYTLDSNYLADAFGRTPPALWQEVHDRILDLIARARRCTIRCPNGTRATVALAASRTASIVPFTVANFPVMIVPPIKADELNGRLVFTHGLTTTGIHEFPNSELPLPTPITCIVESGRIVEIDGDPLLVAKVEAHFERVGALFGGDRRAVFSWHTGINPTTFYRGSASDAPQRWGGVAFGSPRYTHFHLCGPAPGEVSAAIFDATIAFDDRVIWKSGALAAFTEVELNDLATRHGVRPSVLTARREIGIPLSV